MKIAVVLRQVPDLIEQLEIAGSGTALDWDEARFLVNETDDHALEQALLLKESGEASITVVALDFGEVDNTLFTAAAKGVDQIIKIPVEGDGPPTPQTAAAMYAEVIKESGAELVLVGVSAHDELIGLLAPTLALELGLPYVGVIRGVRPAEAGAVKAFKEFPGAVLAKMNVRLPAVLGILAADQPPRYVPVSRIRAAMKSTQFDEKEVAAATVDAGVTVERMYLPEVSQRAEMIEGSVEEVAGRILKILSEKGLGK